MSPQPSTIVLNPSQDHSVTYDSSTSSLTANLPNPIPIEKVANKQKLMLLIYFAQRDQQQSTTRRKIDPQVSLEFNIVERILLRFSSLAQAKRTLKEKVNIGDITDVSNGTGTGQDKSKNMIITQEIKNILLDWFKDVLSSKVFVSTRSV
jgi:hypothetical protein